MMLSFNDFVHKYNWKNEAMSNIRIQQILSSLSSSDVGIYLRDGLFTTDVGSLICIQLTEHIGLHTLTEIILIHTVVHYETNYCLL